MSKLQAGGIYHGITFQGLVIPMRIRKSEVVTNVVPGWNQIVVYRNLITHSKPQNASWIMLKVQRFKLESSFLAFFHISPWIKEQIVRYSRKIINQHSRSLTKSTLHNQFLSNYNSRVWTVIEPVWHCFLEAAFGFHGKKNYFTECLDDLPEKLWSSERASSQSHKTKPLKKTLLRRLTKASIKFYKLHPIIFNRLVKNINIIFVPLSTFKNVVTNTKLKSNNLCFSSSTK